MKIRNEKRLKLRYGICILLFCIALNFVGKYIAGCYQLPVWLDMIGTCVAVSLLGLPYGILVAFLNSFIFTVFYKLEFFYVFTAIVCAVVLDYCTRKSYMEKLSTLLYSSFLTGFSAVMVSTPINLLFNGGRTGNAWGDALFDMLRWYRVPRIPAALAGEVVVEVLDKQICMLLGGSILILLGKVIPWEKWLKKSEKAGAGLLAVCLLLTLSAMPVQAASSTSERFSSRVFNNQNGMISSEANVIAETGDGCIWIGSYAGLTKYDGTDFEFIREGGIASVTAMFCDSGGRLWVGTNDSGIARYENDSFTFFRVQDGLPANSIRCFCEDEEGRVYVGTTDKVCVFEPDDQIRVISDDMFYVVSMTLYDGMLVCCDNNGKLFAVRDGEILASSAESGDAVKNTFFNCVSVTSLGLTAGAADKDLYVLEVKEGAFSLTNNVALPIQGARRIEENSNGKIWVCAENGFGYLKDGLFYEQKVNHFATSLECIHEDYQGNLWVASSRNGVLCLANSPFENLFTKNGIDEVICNAVIPYMSGYMVGTDTGLMLIDRIGGQRESGLTELLQGSRVRSLMKDSAGRIWISSYSQNGLVCLEENGQYTCYQQDAFPQIPSNRVRCTLELSDGSIAAGTSDGMFFVKDREVMNVLTKEDGLTNSQILSLLQGEDGRLYVGSDGSGIFVVQDGQIVENYTTADGLSSDVILRLVPCPDGMLVVTSNGLCLAQKDREITFLTQFPYYNNYDILMDGDTVYVLSSAGIFVVDYNALVGEAPMNYTLYNAKYGLQGAITANSWNYMGEDGSLYICCNDGIVNFLPMKSDAVDFKYGITQVLCDGKEIELKDGEAQIPGNTTEVVVKGSLHNYALTDTKVLFYLEGSQTLGEPKSFSELEPIHISNPTSGKYRIHFEIYDTTGTTKLDEKIFTLTKDVQMWETPVYHAYLIFMVFDVSCFAIFVIVLILDDHRKKKALKEFNVMLGEKVEEQTLEITLQKEQQARLLERTVLALARTVDAKDRYTSGHSTRVAAYSRMIAQRMGKSPEEQEEIYRAGLLHDVGKIRVPEEIINKPGKLTAEEYEIMKLHPITGYHILKEISADKIFSDGARFHHERYDGNGYPNGLAGTQIPEIARIVGVADAYDAMASNRSYRQALPQHIVRSEIENGKGKQFDPQIADIMLDLIDEDREYLMREHASYQKKILLVDDEPVNIRLMEFTFKDDDTYMVEGANSGAQALERLKRESFDIVLMDVKMPGMDGYETARRIREFSSIPIVFITADKLSLNMEEMKANNITDFITRPFKPQILLEILHAVLAK